MTTKGLTDYDAEAIMAVPEPCQDKTVVACCFT